MKEVDKYWYVLIRTRTPVIHEERTRDLVSKPVTALCSGDGADSRGELPGNKNPALVSAGKEKNEDTTSPNYSVHRE